MLDDNNGSDDDGNGDDETDFDFFDKIRKDDQADDVDDDSDMIITMRVMMRWTLVDGDENCDVEDNYDDNIVIM